MNIENIANLSTILSLVVAVIAIIVSVLLYRKSIQHKNLECEMSSIGSLVEVKSQDKEIKIIYKDQVVDNISILFFRIENTGNLAIKRSDVVEPLSIIFPADVMILREPDITKLNPENLNFNFHLTSSSGNTSENVLTLDFDLLNPGDSISFNVLWTGKPVHPKLMCRIEGVRHLAVIDPTTKKRREQKIERTIGYFGIAVIYGISLVISYSWLIPLIADSIKINLNNLILVVTT